jgi:hypothetical protein
MRLAAVPRWKPLRARQRAAQRTTESRSFAARLADLLKREHHAMTDFLVALAEFDQRRAA